MKLTSTLHQKYIYMLNYSLRISTEHWQETLNSLKEQENLPHKHNRSEQKTKVKGTGLGPVPQGGSCEEEEGSCTLGSPSRRKSARTEGELQSLSGEYSNWFAAARIERGLHREGHCPPLYTPSLRCVSTGACEGWVWAFRLQRSYPGRRLGVGCANAVLRVWSLVQPHLKVHAERPGHLRGQVLLCGSVRQGGIGVHPTAFHLQGPAQAVGHCLHELQEWQ